MINVLKNIFKPILFIIGIVLIIALVASWVAAIISLFAGQSYLVYLFPDQLGLATATIGSSFLMIGLPLVGVIFILSRFLFRSKVSPFWSRSVLLLSIFSWMFFFGSASYLATNFQERRTTEVFSQSITNIDRLNISLFNNSKYKNEDDFDHLEIGENFSFFKGEEELVIANTELNFRKSKDNQIHVRQIVYSFGKEGKEAREITENLNYNLEIKDNNLRIPQYLFIPKGSKFRGQKVTVFIEIPEGKSIHRDKKVLYITNEFESKEQEVENYRNCDFWTMMQDGFRCADVPKTQERIGSEEL